MDVNKPSNQPKTIACNTIIPPKVTRVSKPKAGHEGRRTKGVRVGPGISRMAQLPAPERSLHTGSPFLERSGLFTSSREGVFSENPESHRLLLHLCFY